MTDLAPLIGELEELDREYLALSNLRFFMSGGDNEEFRNRLKKAGQLIIDYYASTFVPKYESVTDGAVRDARQELSSFVRLASRCLDNEAYLELGNILIRAGDEIGAPDNLKRLITRLREEDRKRKGKKKRVIS